MELALTPSSLGIVVEGSAKYLAALGLIVCLLIVVIALDYADLLFRSFPYMRLAPAYPHGYLKGRFARWEAGQDMEDTLVGLYNRFTKNGQVFARKTELNNWVLVFPAAASREWRSLPVDQISFRHWVTEGALFKNHTILTKAHSQVLLSYSTKEKIREVHELVLSETDKILPNILGDVKDWVRFDALMAPNALLLRLAATFVFGPGFADDEVFMQQLEVHGYGVDGVNTVYYEWPRFLWGAVLRFHPTLRAFNCNIAQIQSKLLPAVQRRVAEVRAQSDKRYDNGPADVSLMTALIKQKLQEGSLDTVPGSLEETKVIRALCMEILFYIYEFWGPITSTLFFMIMQMMATPEYAEPLRKEVSSALQCNNGWHSEFLTQVPKLDSFTREALRLFVPAQSTVSRRTEKPIHLKSMNMDIPAGVNLCVPTRYIHLDPDNYSNPATFDGYRFYDPKTNTATVRPTTASDTYLSYSHGSGLCPGRFLGVHLIELLFAKFLMEYEFKADPDEDQAFPSIQPTKEGRGDLNPGRTGGFIRARSCAKF